VFKERTLKKSLPSHIIKQKTLRPEAAEATETQKRPVALALIGRT
jgi:hypothetical protein